MAKSKRVSRAEWIGGIAPLPGYVTNEGEPYRPEVLLWMTADGAIVGNALGKPGEMRLLASDNLRETALRPLLGPPRSPTRVRVASAELAEALRAGHPGLEVVCAPTPEIDAAMASMREHMNAQDDEDDEDESFLAGGHAAEAMGGLFRAAAAFYRAKPWKVVPDDASLFSISVDSLSVDGAVVAVIGQMGESFGFIVFESLDDYDRYGEMAEAVERGEEPRPPPHFALNFERGAELSPSLRKEIATYGWEVAAADAYPWIAAVDPDLIARPPTANELALAECVCLALPEVLRDEKKLRKTWDTGKPYQKALTVRAHARERDVVVRAPHEDELAEAEHADETMGATRAANDAIAQRFALSPEGKSLGDGRHAGLLPIDFANDYFGVSVTELRPRELRELLFELVPSKVMMDPADAPETIAEMRAFYTFMKREFALPHAEECLRVLGGDAPAKLKAALSDSSKFGMGKAMLTAGRDAGFDISTKEGIDAWMRELQNKPLPPSISLPWQEARPVAGHTDKRAKKDKRKAARKARKKNR